MGKFRPMPDDFLDAYAQARSANDLVVKYSSKHKIITRWMQEAGLPRFPTGAEASRKHPPACFKANAPIMSKSSLAGRYQVCSATVNRWLDETGLTAKPYQTPIFHKKQSKPADIPPPRRDSPEELAADYLRKWMPVSRCNETGKSVDGGKWWRVGRLVLDSGELVERASAKRAREIA